MYVSKLAENTVDIRKPDILLQFLPSWINDLIVLTLTDLKWKNPFSVNDQRTYERQLYIAITARTNLCYVSLQNMVWMQLLYNSLRQTR